MVVGGVCARGAQQVDVQAALGAAFSKQRVSELARLGADLANRAA